MPDTYTPRLRPNVTVVSHSPDIVELRTGVWNARSTTLTDDKESGTLSPLIRGLQSGKNHADLSRELKVSRSELEATIDTLTELGLIETEPAGVYGLIIDKMSPFPTRAEAFAGDIIVIGAPAIGARVAEQIGGGTPGNVHVLPANDPVVSRLFELDQNSFANGLDAQRLFEEFAEWKDALIVFAVEVINPVAFHVVNHLSGGVGFTWIHAAMDGPYLFIGPTVIPGRSASYDSFERRVIMNMRETEAYSKYQNAIVEHKVTFGDIVNATPLRDLLSSHLSLEVLNWVQSGNNFTINKCLGIYLPTMEIAFHEILPLPDDYLSRTTQTRDSSDLYFDVRDWLNA